MREMDMDASLNILSIYDNVYCVNLWSRKIEKFIHSHTSCFHLSTLLILVSSLVIQSFVLFFISFICALDNEFCMTTRYVNGLRFHVMYVNSKQK